MAEKTWMKWKEIFCYKNRQLNLVIIRIIFLRLCESCRGLKLLPTGDNRWHLLPSPDNRWQPMTTPDISCTPLHTPDISLKSNLKIKELIRPIYNAYWNNLSYLMGKLIEQAVTYWLDHLILHMLYILAD